MPEPKRARLACAMMNGDFICVVTMSRYRATQIDPRGAWILLPLDASDADLGKAAKEALGKSRFLTVREAEALLDGASHEYYTRKIAELAERYHHRTRRGLFDGMKNCSLELAHGVVTIQPTEQGRLDDWTDLDDHQRVTIEEGSSAEELGAALRVGFSRCIC